MLRGRKGGDKEREKDGTQGRIEDDEARSGSGRPSGTTATESTTTTTTTTAAAGATTTLRILLTVLLTVFAALLFQRLRSSPAAAASLRQHISNSAMSPATTTARKTPVYFVSHGGPNVIYETSHPAHAALGRLGAHITRDVVRAQGVRGVVVLSAHWAAGETSPGFGGGRARVGGVRDRPRVEVNVSGRERLIYDFYGFPDYYYKATYPHTHDASLAQDVLTHLRAANLDAVGVNRGMDHGVWAVFKCMFDPEKNPLNVPIVQVSLLDVEDAALHYDLGKAIAKLREDGVLVICSGMAVHNLRDLRFAFNSPQPPLPYVPTFDDALRDAVTGSVGEERKVSMEKLLRRDDARKAHPTIEHLLPIYVAAGAAEGEEALQIYTYREMAFSWAQFRFGGA